VGGIVEAAIGERVSVRFAILIHRRLHLMLNRIRRAICINLIALDRPEAIRYDKFSLRPADTKAPVVFPASHRS
jgi:hypothetical protein